jgi:surfeit locus 1 family protein
MGPKPRKDQGWGILLLTILGVVIALSLAMWQLGRAAYKQNIEQQISAYAQMPPVDDIAQVTLNAVGHTGPVDTQAWIHRYVDLQGQWLNQYTVFLDNRYMDGRAGFYVVTPFQQDRSSAVVWVQRGWLARDGQDRLRLPPIATPKGTVQLKGRIIAAVSQVYAMGDSAENRSGLENSAPIAARTSQIRQNLPVLSLVAPLHLLPVAVLQTQSPAPPDGLQRTWPLADAGVAKHYGYAFQWFALCGLIIALYVWFQILAPRRRKIAPSDS